MGTTPSNTNVLLSFTLSSSLTTTIRPSVGVVNEAGARAAPSQIAILPSSVASVTPPPEMNADSDTSTRVPSGGKFDTASMIFSQLVPSYSATSPATRADEVPAEGVPASSATTTSPVAGVAALISVMVPVPMNPTPAPPASTCAAIRLSM